jgi:ComF family protein
MLLDLLAPPICWSCHAPARRGSALCGECRRSLRFLGEAAGAAPLPVASALPVWAAVAYEGAARELVRALKFRGATAVAEEMAALIVANAPAALLAPGQALVPVPLHPRRHRTRGFNQAERLARALSRRTGLPVSGCLARAGPAARQAGRDRSARLRGPPGSIHASAAVPVAALLVDDVVTTGATLAACAAELRAAGCARVAALAFARTTGR